MDTARLPAYRSSYLLRFHPYPRTKLSTRERMMAAASEDASYDPLRMNALYPESDASFTLNKAIHGAPAEVELRQRRLSVSSLVVDLAFLCIKQSPVQGD